LEICGETFEFNEWRILTDDSDAIPRILWAFIARPAGRQHNMLPIHGEASGKMRSAPDLASGFGDELQLGPLLIFGQEIAFGS
jgi:hypothetical protein